MRASESQFQSSTEVKVNFAYLLNRVRGAYLMLLTFDCLSAQAINQRGKREDPSLTVDREGDVSKIVIISLLSVSDGSGNDFYS